MYFNNNNIKLIYVYYAKNNITKKTLKNHSIVVK